MKRILVRLSALIVALAVFAVTGLSSAVTSTAATTAAATAQTTSASPIHAHVTGTTAKGGTLAGRFTPTRFVKRPTRVVAVGSLVGTLTRANGNTVHVDQTVRMPVRTVDFIGKRTATGTRQAATVAATGSCQIVDLVLGPLDLDLLGVVVHLNKVHLNITAQTGPGELLGNLLCAVANLLNGVSLSGLLGKVTRVLNRILGALG